MPCRPNHPAIDVKVGRNIRKQRLKRRRSVRELAIMTGISERRLRACEAGARRICLSDIAKIACALKIGIGELLRSCG